MKFNKLIPRYSVYSYRTLVNLQYEKYSFVTDIRIISDITASDNELFVSWICPCVYLQKITFM
jgi:hypothetical protein